MPTVTDLLFTSALTEPDAEWLHSLVGDWQFIADLALADLVLWIPDRDGQLAAAAHARPSGAATVFYRDLIGQPMKPEWRALADQAMREGRAVSAEAPDWYEHAATRLKAIPVTAGYLGAVPDRPIAVITKHANLTDARTPSRLELVYLGCANDILDMVADGTYPDYTMPSGPRRGAPRVSDGMMRLNTEGTVTFASPNALSAFKRLGFDGELEGRNLAEATTQLLPERMTIDESLPLVLTGRSSWRSDVEAQGVTVGMRSIPIKQHGHRIGALLLCRDVTDLRRQEQELLTKDATIR